LGGATFLTHVQVQRLYLWLKYAWVPLLAITSQMLTSGLLLCLLNNARNIAGEVDRQPQSVRIINIYKNM